MKQIKKSCQSYISSQIVQEKALEISDLYPSLHLILKKDIKYHLGQDKFTKYALKDSFLPKRSKENIRNKNLYFLLRSLLISPSNYYDIFAPGHQFQSCTSLEIIFMTGIHSYLNTTLNKLLAHLKGFRFLQKLKISSHSFALLTPYHISILLKAISYSPGLRDLSLELKFYQKLNDDTVFRLARLIRKLKHIEKLNILLPNYSQLSIRAIGAISQSIPFKSDYFTINIQNYLRGLNLTGFSNYFEKVCVYENLDMSYTWEENFRMMNKYEFDNCIKSFIVFKRVNLDFKRRDLTKIECSLSKFSRKLSPIYFNLYISKFEMENKRLNSLLESIKDFIFIEELNLDFSHSQTIFDKHLLQVSELINRFQKLNKFSLACKSCSKLTVSCIKSLGKSLAKRTTLKSLSLDFSNCNLNKVSIGFLLQCISNLENLENLKLSFDKLTYYGGQLGLKPSDFEFIIPIKELVFKMGFMISCANNRLALTYPGDYHEYYHSFNDEDAVLFATLIRNRWNVSQLELDFPQKYSELKELGTQVIIESLCEFQILTKLTLNFKNFRYLRDQDVITLAKWIGNLSFLEHLNLNLNGCSKISDEGILALSKSINQLDQLESCLLHMLECELISEKVSTLFKKL